MTDALQDDIILCLPHLRAFARMLAQDRTVAEDLVQETVLQALTHANQFQPGTNLKAWLSTILRNSYFNERRRRSRMSQLSVELVASGKTVSGGQEDHLRMRDFERAFTTLSEVQREALVLVGASGFSYEEAAAVASCAIGTMKSRVSRARFRLQRLLDGEDVPESAALPPPVRDGIPAMLSLPA